MIQEVGKIEDLGKETIVSHFEILVVISHLVNGHLLNCGGNRGVFKLRVGLRTVGLGENRSSFNPRRDQECRDANTKSSEIEVGDSDTIWVRSREGSRYVIEVSIRSVRN